MTATLRERAEHAAKYGSNLMVPARDIQRLLDQAEQAEARIQTVRGMHQRADCTEGDYCEHCPCTCRAPGAWPCPTIRALDGDPQ